MGQGDPAVRWRGSVALGAGIALAMLGLMILVGTPLISDRIATLMFRWFKAADDSEQAFRNVSNNVAFFVVGIGSACVLCGLVLLARGRRRRKATDAGDVLDRDQRPPVLYLRSFQTDAIS